MGSRIKLADVAEIRLGYQNRKMLQHQTDGEVHIIQGKDVSKDNQIISDRMIRMKSDGFLEKYFLQENDILFMAKGAVNYSICVDFPPERMVPSSSFYFLRITHDALLPGYLAWWLNQSMARNYFEKNRSRSATISFISAAILKNTPIQVPGMKTQKMLMRIEQLERVYSAKLQRQKDLWDEITANLMIKIVKMEDK